MNAIELANKIEKGGNDGFYQDEMVAILRQQAKKIEQLEVDVEHYADRWRDACGNLQIEKDFKQLKLRELTDKEIWQIHDATNTNNWVIDFARAIIKKASEK